MDQKRKEAKKKIKKKRGGVPKEWNEIIVDCAKSQDGLAMYNNYHCVQ